MKTPSAREVAESIANQMLVVPPNFIDLVVAAIEERDRALRDGVVDGNPLGLCRTCFHKGALLGCPGCADLREERRDAEVERLREDLGNAKACLLDDAKTIARLRTLLKEGAGLVAASDCQTTEQLAWVRKVREVING